MTDQYANLDDAYTRPVVELLTPLQQQIFEAAAHDIGGDGDDGMLYVLACLSVHFDGRPAVALCAVTGEADGAYVLTPQWLAVDEALAAKLHDPDGATPDELTTPRPLADAPAGYVDAGYIGPLASLLNEASCPRESCRHAGRRHSAEFGCLVEDNTDYCPCGLAPVLYPDGSGAHVVGWQPATGQDADDACAQLAEPCDHTPCAWNDGLPHSFGAGVA